MFRILLIAVTAAFVANANASVVPKLHDYDESTGSGQKLASKDATTGPVSEVSISVGETYFYYTVNGETYSPFKIATSGEYYNDEGRGVGGVWLYMVVETGVGRWWIQPQPNNVLKVIIQNAYAEFDFYVIPPQGVSVYNNMRGGLYNATAVVVTGPSRSSPYF